MAPREAPAMETTPAADNPVTLDDVLANEMGQFGWYQLRNLALLALPIMVGAFKTDYIFSAAKIPHRCHIPECEESNGLYQYNPDWILNAVPETSSGFSSCQRYLPLTFASNKSDFCPASLFNQSQVINCETYMYAANNTIVYDFNLGCQEWLRVLPGTFSNIGQLLGLPVTGYFSDRFGRRFVLIFGLLGMGIVGFIRAFSVNYSMFMALQLVQTCFGAGVYSSAFILAVELIGSKYRGFTSACTMSMFSIGEIVLGSTAWITQSWRRMAMILYPPFVLILLYFWMLPESIRWLLSKKKYDRAIKTLQMAAKMNKKHLSEKSLTALTSPKKAASETPQIKMKAPSLFRNVIKSPVLLRRVCITPIWWITATLVYYGLSINSTSFSNTIYLNYILTCAIEIPGCFTGVVFVDKIGRKATLSLGFFFSSLCNISFVFIPSAYPTSRLLVYMLGKFSISAVMMMLYLYTSELYPTVYRHRLLAFSSTVGRLGSIVAPLTPVLATYWHGAPNLVFGFMCILSGFLSLTQPETLGSKLPDTLEDAEALGKSGSKVKQVN